MKRTAGLVCLLLGTVVGAACSSPTGVMDDYELLAPDTMLLPPGAGPEANYPVDQVEQGRYLVGLLGCGTCHSNGALIGQTNRNQLLSGSSIGIAYSNPWLESRPGIVFPSNLTPDRETGIGNWTPQQIVTMLRSGIDNHGSQALPVMPWPGFAQLTEDDALAIAVYLLSLPPVRHQVPANVAPGQDTAAPYVHFGVYRSRL